MRYLSDSVASTAYRVSRKLVKVECDICGTEIIAASRNWNDDTGRYFEVTTGHRDWGNDSCDSIETKDVCPACLSTYVSNYFKENHRSHTAYCDIESAVAYPKTETTVVDKLPDETTLIKEDHDYY